MLAVGDRLGSFTITGTLGAGGMGLVFAAVDDRLRRPVAIKVLLGEGTTEARLRLVREARVAASLDHPGIVRIHELGETDRLVYVVMELVRGRSLGDVLAAVGKAPPGAVAAAGEAIARAAAAAHAAGVVHRDIKPRNVMLRVDGAIKVLDFGLAKPMTPADSARITVSGAIHGTPVYLAPELLDASDPSPVSDVWALGVSLAELATGVPPYAGKTLPQLFSAIAHAPPALDAIEPPALRAVVARALVKAPGERTPSMRAFAEALHPLADVEALAAWAQPVLAAVAEPVVSVRSTPAGDAGPSSFAATQKPSTPPSSGADGPTRPSRPPRADEPAGHASPGAPAEVRAAGSAAAHPAPTAPATEIGGEPAETPARSASGPRTSRALDEGALDDFAGRIAALPEPLASLAVSVEVARAEADATGIRKRLFELGVGVVRYATAVGLAVLAARLGASSAPRPVADALARAARMSDGQWCDLSRRVASALKPLDAPLAKAMAFTSAKPLAELVTARNEFVHGGGTGDQALALCTAVLDGAESLLALPLRMVVGLSPPSFEARVGTPVRAGVWRKTAGAVPATAVAGAAHLVLGGPAGDWVVVTPFLPLVDKKLVVLDSPHSAGKPWRSFDPETGEHRDHPALDDAVRRLVGADPNAPRELTDRPALVGRSAALKVLTRAAEEASQGGIRVVALTGPFGIGRTRLAEAVAEAAAGFGFGRVLFAACSPERRAPLRPLRRALEGAAGLERVRDAMGRALTVDPLAAKGGLDAGLEAIEEALVEASLEEPTVLAVDDAQWADELTLAVLRLLTERANRKAAGKLLVVTTSRDEPNPAPALKRFIGQVEQDVGTGATRMPLGPLDEADATKLVQGVAPIASSVERTIVGGAGGVPFFLVQPLLVWSETGALVWQDGAWAPRDAGVLTSSAPGVKDLVHARLGSYFEPGSDAERAAHVVLATVALWGSMLSIDRLMTTVEAAGTSPVAGEHALEALVQSGLLVVRGDTQEHDFAQGLVRQAVLEELKQKPWFRRLHRALLDVVAKDDDADDAPFLAAGYETLGAKDLAAHWLRRAVEAALGSGAFDAAAELGERLAKTGRDATERARAGLSVVKALLGAGQPDRAEERLSAVDASADALVDVERRILAVQVAALHRDAGADADPTLLGDADATGHLALRVDARIALATLARGERGLALADEAVALARTSGPHVHYRALAVRAERLVEFPRGIAERLRNAERMRDLAHELGSAWAELDAMNYVAVAKIEIGDLGGAIADLEHVSDEAERARFGSLRRESLVNLANAKLRSGAPKEAANTAVIAAAAGRAAGDTRLVVWAESLRADALLQAGDLAGAREAIETAAPLALLRDDYTATLALLRRGEIRCRAGDSAAGRADLDDARTRALAASHRDLAARAEVLLALDRARAAESGAVEALAELVTELARDERTLRAPTLRLLKEGRTVAGLDAS